MNRPQQLVCRNFKGEDPENMEIELTCKCKHRFSIHTNILLPRNCTYNLGKSFTITCPKCKEDFLAEGTEPLAIVVEPLLQHLEQKLRNYIQKRRQSFKAVGFMDFSTGQFRVECRSCHRVFDLNMYEGKNAYYTSDALTLKCPGCGAEDTTTIAQMTTRAEFLADVACLHELRNVMLQLEGGNNGQQVCAS